MKRHVVTRFFTALALSSLSALAVASGGIDINTASAEQLAEHLSGVGEARAQAIIDYREENGPFATADDLTRVSGVGPATVEQNRQHILTE
ncbi:competence protein ComEA [Alkalispirillum mobile]|uniref:Competence protein ComEA n=1 Tax=Alkalispirillum mobile TaxID=85925 RepID=A0A498C8X3_9GAMM|nr:helix-hairpin-helix domain-containing protein [Alkalispirillum mobile]RLK48751.1 competence protein ComEA [Alkalispirillum mobile]